jgi:2-keto-4-pentenoate hydratase/2-oxohepta-3-ene-1,7-dioic acid hydratase in catechol pathway
MRLVRFGQKGSERPGLLDAQGRVRDLSGQIADIDGAALAPASLARLAALDASQLPLVEENVRFGAPVGGTRNFIAVGLNYAEHVAEAGRELPEEPVLFNKATSCISGADDGFPVPRAATRTDWEVELAVVIGSRAQYLEKDSALDVVAGYCLCNDVSERSFQSQRGGQWVKGKSAEGFGPIGPWLLTSDEVADPQNIDLWLDLNGERMQTGSTSTMIFGVAHLVWYISQFMVLEPGDIITTGTPPGVGNARKPPRYLQPGDVVELGGEGLGRQRQVVRAAV